MILVIDASVTIAWIAEDERSAYADAAIEACGTDRAVVPLLWYWEIANTLLVLERKGRLGDASATYATIVRALPVDGDPTALLQRTADEISFARRHALSVYDAAYLALAKSQRILLATLDARLARAARDEGAYFQP